MSKENLAKRDKERKRNLKCNDETGRFDPSSGLSTYFRSFDHISPNPPPARIGKFAAKTLARMAVSDCIDCGSWKNQAIMQRHIDHANRDHGISFPSKTTMVKALRLNDEKAIQRANKYWTSHGHKVNGKWAPYLTLVDKGRTRPDGTGESNAYQIGWRALFACLRDLHPNEPIRAAAAAYLNEPSSSAEE
jgi:hypothetical protein